MDIREFEKTTDQITLMNNFAIPHVDLSIGHYGYEQTTKDKEYVSSKGYPTYRLHYITEGSLWLVISGKKHKLKKHYCFYLRPDLDIGFSTNPEDPAKFYWVSFVGQNALSYLEKMGFSEGKFSFYVPTKTQKRLRRAYFSSFDIPEALKPATDVVFTENFMKITETLMLSSNINRQEAPPKAKKRYVEETLQLINARYMNPGLSIKEVARELFLHENYLSKLFKAETKMSFNTYLSRYRIEQSLKMMVQGHTSVSSIAFAVGFSDPLYFSKVFKLLNQITPSEHIRKINAKK